MGDVRKVSFGIDLSAEIVAVAQGFEQHGHMEPVEVPDADRREYERAVAVLRELESNRFIHYGYDGPELVGLETEQWVADETHEEWMRRFHEAGNQADGSTT